MAKERLLNGEVTEVEDANYVDVGEVTEPQSGQEQEEPDVPQNIDVNALVAHFAETARLYGYGIESIKLVKHDKHLGIVSRHDFTVTK